MCRIEPLLASHEFMTYVVISIGNFLWPLLVVLSVLQLFMVFITYHITV